jgi:hypothetical protein
LKGFFVANILETQIINESEKSVIIRSFLQGDGTGEIVNVPLLSYLELTPPLTKGYLAVREIFYQITNFTLLLSYKSNVGNEGFWAMCPSVDSHQNFESFGGLIDTTGMYSEGQLTLTSFGLTSPASYASFVIRCSKHIGTNKDFYKRVGRPQGEVPGVTALFPNTP